MSNVLLLAEIACCISAYCAIAGVVFVVARNRGYGTEYGDTSGLLATGWPLIVPIWIIVGICRLPYSAGIYAAERFTNRNSRSALPRAEVRK